MAREISVGIDIGTYHAKVVVAERSSKHSSFPRIIGTGYAESKGLRYGYIVNSEDVTRCVKRAVKMAEKAAGIEIKSAFIGVGGVSLDAKTSLGTSIVTRADSLVSDRDIESAHAAAEEAIPTTERANKKIIHSIPISYTLDGKPILGRPHDMKGTKLVAKVLFIMGLEQHLHDLVEAVEKAGIEVEDVIAAPLAASLVVLTPAQKIAGCVLVNIGSETVSLVTYENNLPLSLEVFPIGSTDITHDIALGLKVPLEEAEQIKLGGSGGGSFSKQELDDIIVTRLTNIFELIQNHLKKINRDEMLPAGIVLTGGGSGIETIEDLARATLRLPSKVGELQTLGSEKPRVRDATWSVAYGLCVLGMSTEKEKGNSLPSFRKAIDTFISWVRQFLP